MQRPEIPEVSEAELRRSTGGSVALDRNRSVCRVESAYVVDDPDQGAEATEAFQPLGEREDIGEGSP
jgi:hypothetical protein